VTTAFFLSLMAFQRIIVVLSSIERLLAACHLVKKPAGESEGNAERELSSFAPNISLPPSSLVSRNLFPFFQNEAIQSIMTLNDDRVVANISPNRNGWAGSYTLGKLPYFFSKHRECGTFFIQYLQHCTL